MDYIEQARECLQIEIEAITKIKDRLGDDFVRAIQLIIGCAGRVVVTGIGKSGWVGQKISSTLASTGTPSFFLHPAEAIHGDLGMVMPVDVVLVLSNSGETEEILRILPTLKRLETKIIALCGRRESTLAQCADAFLDTSVEREACPLGLAPTASTTATMAFGDALAVALLRLRNFTPEEFAFLHPGGALGRKLLSRVSDFMHAGDDNPKVVAGRKVKEAIFSMTVSGLGATNVVDEMGLLLGIITDGDIRRGLERYGNALLEEQVENLMTKTAKTISANELAVVALNIMEKNKPTPITVLPVVDAQGHSVGMLHMTLLLKAGVV